jgi:hypothetical protein
MGMPVFIYGQSTLDTYKGHAHSIDMLLKADFQNLFIYQGPRHALRVGTREFSL